MYNNNRFSTFNISPMFVIVTLCFIHAEHFPTKVPPMRFQCLQHWQILCVKYFYYQYFATIILKDGGSMNGQLLSTTHLLFHSCYFLHSQALTRHITSGKHLRVLLLSCTTCAQTFCENELLKTFWLNIAGLFY